MKKTAQPVIFFSRRSNKACPYIAIVTSHTYSSKCSIVVVQGKACYRLCCVKREFNARARLPYSRSLCIWECMRAADSEEEEEEGKRTVSVRVMYSLKKTRAAAAAAVAVVSLSGKVLVSGFLPSESRRHCRQLARATS